MKREPAVRSALSKMYRSGKNTGVLHDMKCTGAMHPLSSDVIKASHRQPMCLSLAAIQRMLHTDKAAVKNCQLL